MLADPRNNGRNLVAVLDDRIIGAVTYDCSDASTAEPLEVAIFARNPSREFYRRHGFREYGDEFRPTIPQPAHYRLPPAGSPVRTRRSDVIVMALE
jgi:hypothetical protein